MNEQNGNSGSALEMGLNYTYALSSSQHNAVDSMYVLFCLGKENSSQNRAEV